ncbi:uncharacterized protein Fot_09542 [Forsythia ovata]|uniref:Uncharacterized protein n=1 Tax=Forsythia ovata TaxID=205694 RepID=A0ABD1WEM3_9LAMI
MSDEMDRVEEWVEYIRVLSKGHKDPNFDLEYWACNKYSSKLNVFDFAKLRDKYKVPEGVKLIFPNKKERHCSSPEGHVAIMRDTFACGMRLPIYLFFRAILRSYNVCPYQMSLNFWTQSVGARGTHILIIIGHPSFIKYWRSQWLWAVGE